jgi:hypothetical protein
MSEKKAFGRLPDSQEQRNVRGSNNNHFDALRGLGSRSSDNNSIIARKMQEYSKKIISPESIWSELIQNDRANFDNELRSLISAEHNLNYHIDAATVITHFRMPDGQIGSFKDVYHQSRERPLESAKKAYEIALKSFKDKLNNYKPRINEVLNDYKTFLKDAPQQLAAQHDRLEQLRTGRFVLPDDLSLDNLPPGVRIPTIQDTEESIRQTYKTIESAHQAIRDGEQCFKQFEAFINDQEKSYGQKSAKVAKILGLS